MAQTTVNAQINDTYNSLTALIAKNNCKITAQQTPNAITALQGSLWGTTPKTAQKTITFTLTPTQQGTTIQSKSQLTRNYLYLTAVGVVFSVGLMVVCGWIAFDMHNAAFGSAGFWSWLAQTNGYFDAHKADIFTKVPLFLAGFLAVTLAIEAFVLRKVQSGIESWAEEILKKLKQPP